MAGLAKHTGSSTVFGSPVIPKDFVIGTEMQQEDIHRLESKIDKLAEAVNRLVVVEDRQLRLNESIIKFNTDLDKAYELIRLADAKIERLISYGRAASWVVGTAFTFLTGTVVFFK